MWKLARLPLAALIALLIAPAASDARTKFRVSAQTVQTVAVADGYVYTYRRARRNLAYHSFVDRIRLSDGTRDVIYRPDPQSNIVSLDAGSGRVAVVEESVFTPYPPEWTSGYRTTVNSFNSDGSGFTTDATAAYTGNGESTDECGTRFRSVKIDHLGKPIVEGSTVREIEPSRECKGDKFSGRLFFGYAAGPWNGSAIFNYDGWSHDWRTDDGVVRVIAGFYRIAPVHFLSSNAALQKANLSGRSVDSEIAAGPSGQFAVVTTLWKRGRETGQILKLYPLWGSRKGGRKISGRRKNIENAMFCGSQIVETSRHGRTVSLLSPSGNYIRQLWDGPRGWRVFRMACDSDYFAFVGERPNTNKAKLFTADIRPPTNIE